MHDNGQPRFGSYVFLGFAIGGITGMIVEAGNGNTFFGFWIGALLGGFLGCFAFIATAILQSQNRKKHNK